MIYPDSVFLSNEKTPDQFNSYLNLDSEGKQKQEDPLRLVKEQSAQVNHLLRSVLPSSSLEVQDLLSTAPSCLHNNLSVYLRLLQTLHKAQEKVKHQNEEATLNYH